MCACTEPVRTGIGAVCVEYGRPKWPITMLNHTDKVQKNVSTRYFLFLAPYACSYDPLWWGFFAWRQNTASVASLPRPCLITISSLCWLQFSIKKSGFEPDVLIPPTLSGFGLKAVCFSTILLNLDFNGVRFLVKCGSLVIVSSMLTGAFASIVNGAKALRGALRVPLPG